MRRFWSRHGSGRVSGTVAPRPRTLLGRHLRATALRQREEHDRTHAELTRTDWIGLEEMWEAMFRSAVRRHFRPDAPVRDIAAFVQSIRSSGYADLYPQFEAEAMIREILGWEVEVSGIEIEPMITIRLLTVVGVHDASQMSEHELDTWIREIEDEVLAAGHTLTLAEPDNPSGG